MPATFEFPEVLCRPAPPPEPPAPPPALPPVLRALAMAHRIQDEIHAGTCRDLAEAARKLGVSRARVTQLSNLLLLSPTIQTAILTASPGDLQDLTERRLRHIVAVPDWDGQAALWARLRPKT